MDTGLGRTELRLCFPSLGSVCDGRLPSAHVTSEPPPRPESLGLPDVARASDWWRMCSEALSLADDTGLLGVEVKTRKLECCKMRTDHNEEL